MDHEPSAAPSGGPAFLVRWARTAWLRASIGALVAAGIGLLMAEVSAFGFALAGRTPGSALTTARVGALLFYAFHHVPLMFDATLRPLAGVPSGHIGVRFAQAPMLGTLVVGCALFVAGRSLARTANPPSASAAGAVGAAVAVPYAVLCGVGTVLAHVTVPVTGTTQALFGGPFTVGPALAEAFLWPALLAAVAGFAGGATAVAPRPAPDRRSAPLGAVVAGGGTMAALALTLSFAGLLVMAAVDTGATRAYFHGAFGAGATRGVAAVGLTILEVPNMATWVLEPAMGSCLAVARPGHGDSCVVSYRRIPGRDPLGVLDAAGGSGRRAPSAYLLFLLAPAAAVVIGGRLAARRAAASSIGAAARAGAMAGAVFAAWSTLFVLLSRISVSIGGAGAARVGGAETLAIGPAILLSIAVSVAWGLLGGAAGGTIGAILARGRGAPVRERVFPVAVPAPASAPASAQVPSAMPQPSVPPREADPGSNPG